MKTSQGSEVLSPEKKVNEVQEILDFTRNFIDSHGRFPKLRELPAKKVLSFVILVLLKACYR